MRQSRWDNRPRFLLRAFFAAAATAAVSLCGCAVGPDYHPPAPNMRGAFDDSIEAPPTGATTRPAAQGSGAPVDLVRWWQALNDPLLNQLVRQSVRSNYDIRIAIARLQEAREIEFALGGGVVEGLGAPAPIDISAGAGRGSGTDSIRGRLAAPVYAGTNTNGLSEITHAAGFDAGWEIDLFGRYTRLLQAAHADTGAAAEFHHDVLIATVAEVVRSYIDVRALQLRLEIARENSQSQGHMANLVGVRFQRGLTNELDVALADRQYARTLAQIAPLEAGIVASQRRIAVLLGHDPELLRSALEKPAPLPAVPPQVSAGMPLTLLRRRPDIRQAERNLAAATARIGVATANLFPTIALTAGAGFQGQGLGQKPELSSFIWSVGPSFYWPFLDFGQLDAAVKISDYRAVEMLYRYRSLVITAVEQVDDALSNYSAEQQSLAQLNVAVQASRKAVHLAQRRYENGLTDFLNVLDAQRQLYDLEDQTAVAQQTLTDQFIALYKALGGGWEGFEAPPPPPRPGPAAIAAGMAVIDKAAGK